MHWMRRKLGGWLMFVGFRILPDNGRQAVSLTTAVGIEWATTNKNLEMALAAQLDRAK
ncbi:MAG: hypothetical protein JWP25_4659 [Bradyrhizobium sp.]|nr:hypothetical protein [Bradyrhizobium sp.]